MVPILPMLVLPGAVWLLGTFGGLASLLIAWMRPGERRSFCWGASLLAVLGGTVGVWSPEAFWPQLVYSYSSGSLQFTVDFRWLFLLPLLIGSAGAYFLLRGERS